MSTNTIQGQPHPGQAAELDYRRRINHLLGYIHEHLAEAPTLQELSGVAGFSAFHLHRIFAAFVGEPLGEHIRRLRMRRAAHLLAHTRQPVTAIAFSAGYATPAAFAKAFRQSFALSPSQYRQRGGQALPSMAQAAPRTPLERRSTMQPEFRQIPEQRVLSVRRRGLINNNFDQAADEAFDVLCAYIQQQHAWDQVGACLGITPDETSDTAPQQAIYDASFVLKENASLQPGGEAVIQIIPAGRWAVFRHRGPYNTLWQTWNAIYRDWLPASGERLRDTAPYEVYLKDKHSTPEAELESDVYIPLGVWFIFSGKGGKIKGKQEVQYEQRTDAQELERDERRNHQRDRRMAAAAPPGDVSRAGRRSCGGRLKQELSKSEYQLLKGSMWAFRKQPSDLRPEERQTLRRLWKLAPQLKQAYDLRQQLTAIFNQPISQAVGQRKIRTWIQRVRTSGLSCFDEFLKTLHHWWEEITNYFINRANSGFVEGLNNKLKVLKRRCYGIFNLAHLFQRIYLDLEGYRLFAW